MGGAHEWGETRGCERAGDGGGGGAEEEGRKGVAGGVEGGVAVWRCTLCYAQKQFAD